ncbi:MAG: DUF1501 domain-containing protein [Planctomycetes bacterium]|nr:DUF1501 domain-containing protein [Planctomycetota bacterium]
MARDCEGFSRRDFIKVGSAGLLGLTLPQLLQLESQVQATPPARGQARRATSVIMVWLAGGPATIDMWDLRPNATENIRGEFREINTSADGVRISEHLPQMARVMNRTTVVRSLAHTIPSHGPATIFMTTGNRPTPATQYPSLGSLVTRLMPAAPGVPPYVSFTELRNGTAGQAGYLGTAYNPFIVEGQPAARRPARGASPTAASLRVRGITLPTGFTLEQLENRDRLLRNFDETFQNVDRNADLVGGLDAFHRQALEILRSNKTRVAFDLAQEPEMIRERYGMTPFGQGALAARRLIEAGVRFTTVSIGGWDTHGQNFNALRGRLLPQLDQVLSTLIEDLDDRGMLEDTIVYCAGEFGRTPRINNNAGRDHWARSMAVVLAGGGFKRGYAHGTTDVNGMAPATDPCTPDDVASTIFTQLGINPHQELQTPTGRPMQLFREGRAIPRLIG